MQFNASGEECNFKPSTIEYLDKLLNLSQPISSLVKCR